jgi:hypothetical protein
MSQCIIDPQLEKCLPPLDEDRLQDLRASLMKGYDKDYPIIVWEGHDIIVDGHHRFAICNELGIEPVVTEKAFESIEDAILYAIDHQTSRRNLTKGQIAIVGMARYEAEEKIAARRRQAVARGRPAIRSGLVPASVQEPKGESAERVAEKAGVKARNVYEIRAIRKKGIPEVERMVMKDGLSPSMADTFVQNTPKDKQTDIVKGGVEAVIDHYHEIKHERQNTLERQKTEEERQKFDEFTKAVAEDTAIAHAKIDRILKAANGGCLLPNCAEKFCDDCKWGFDVYLPTPNAPRCPYCGGNNLSKRDDEWNPRELI